MLQIDVVIKEDKDDGGYVASVPALPGKVIREPRYFKKIWGAGNTDSPATQSTQKGLDVCTDKNVWTNG